MCYELLLGSLLGMWLCDGIYAVDKILSEYPSSADSILAMFSLVHQMHACWPIRQVNIMTTALRARRPD